MRRKRELLCLMLCADPSLSSTTSRATPASSTTELLPIKPIRAWRDPPSGDGEMVGGGEKTGGGGGRESRITRRSMEGRRRGEPRERRRNKKSLSHTPWCLSRTRGEFLRGTALVWRNFLLEHYSLYYPPRINAAQQITMSQTQRGEKKGAGEYVKKHPWHILFCWECVQFRGSFKEVKGSLGSLCRFQCHYILKFKETLFWSEWIRRLIKSLNLSFQYQSLSSHYWQVFNIQDVTCYSRYNKKQHIVQ